MTWHEWSSKESYCFLILHGLFQVMKFIDVNANERRNIYIYIYIYIERERERERKREGGRNMCVNVWVCVFWPNTAIPVILKLQSRFAPGDFWHFPQLKSLPEAIFRTWPWLRRARWISWWWSLKRSILSIFNSGNDVGVNLSGSRNGNFEGDECIIVLGRPFFIKINWMDRRVIFFFFYFVFIVLWLPWLQKHW